MKSSLKYVFITLTIIMVMSFKLKKELIEVKTGKYGICSCSKTSSIIIELTINADSSFHYVNNVDSKKHIDITGKWSLNNNTLILSSYESNFSINNRWSIDKSQKAIKSRKGLLWTSLYHIESCK